MTGRARPVTQFCTMLTVGRRAGAKPSHRAEPDRRSAPQTVQQRALLRVRRQAREARRRSFCTGSILTSFAAEQGCGCDYLTQGSIAPRMPCATQSGTTTAPKAKRPLLAPWNEVVGRPDIAISFARRRLGTNQLIRLAINIAGTSAPMPLDITIRTIARSLARLAGWNVR
jgi:hypothetical protein